MPTPTQTLWDCREVFYWILRERQDATSYPLVLADRFINLAQRKFCSGRIVHPVTKETVGKGTLPFLNMDAYYSNVEPTTLDDDVTTWDTTLTVADTTNFPSSGKLFISGNIITYTGKTSTTFTGCTNVLFSYTSGMQVDIAFSLPSDYMSPIWLIYNNRLQLDSFLYDDIFTSLNAQKAGIYQRAKSRAPYDNPYKMKPFYTIRDASELLIFNLSQTDDMIHLRYEKRPALMSAESDLLTIDDDFYWPIILWYLAVGEMLFNRWEEKKGLELINVAISHSRELYNDYNNSVKESINGKRVKMQKGSPYNF